MPLVKAFCKVSGRIFKIAKTNLKTQKICIFDLQKGCKLRKRNRSSNNCFFSTFQCRFCKDPAADHGRYITVSASATAGRKPRI